MVRYFARRLLYVLPLILGVSFITFLLFHIVGGNPCYIVMGKHANAADIQSCAADLGFDQPLYKQYGRYLNEILHLDFGRSFVTRERVSTILLQGLGPSLSLTIPAFILTNVLALIVALIAAFYRGRWIDRSILVTCVLGMSVTVLAYILAGQYFLAYKWGFFPISGYSNGWAAISYLALPVLIWVVVALGYDVRFYRSVFLDETKQDYVRTAFAKGLSPTLVFFKHVLKNSLVPIVTHLGIQMPFLITGSLLLENFFQIPGVGNLVSTSINNSDFPVLKATVFLGSFMFILFNFLIDLCYAWVDPRLQLRTEVERR